MAVLDIGETIGHPKASRDDVLAVAMTPDCTFQGENSPLGIAFNDDVLEPDSSRRLEALKDSPCFRFLSCAASYVERIAS